MKSKKYKHIIFDIAVYIAFALFLFVAHQMYYNGADTSLNTAHIFGLSCKLPLTEIALWLACSALLAGILSKLIFKNDKNKNSNKNYLIAAAFAAIIILSSSLYIAESGIGYYDNHIKFKCDEYIFKTCQADYNDIEIYKVEGYYYHIPKPGPSKEQYYKYKGTAYAIVAGDNYAALGIVKSDSVDAKRINKIAEKYNKSIKTIHSIKDIGL